MKTEYGKKLKWKFRPKISVAVIFLAIFLAPNFLFAKNFIEGQNPSWISTNKIIFQSKRSGNWDIWEMDNDGGNLKNLTKSPKEETDAVWSSNGKYFAYSGEGKRSEEIFIRQIETNKTYQQTKNNFYDGAPSFSPDGKRIAYEFKISDKLFWRWKRTKLSP
jgi:Tol biopolymer transport system component